MKRLNVDFPRAISRFESMMKSQLLIKTAFYKRIFGGKGFEFDSYRVYSPDNDDAGLIDWKATMRNPARTLVRQYVEERDLKIFLIVDVGDNMVLGSGEKLKNEVVAEIVASLSHLILTSGDSVGMAMYSDKLVKILPPAAGMGQFHNVLRALENPNNYGGKSDLKKTIKYLLPNLKKVSAVFFISDFLNLDDETLKLIKTFSKVYESAGIMIRDKVDTALPDLKNEVVIEDIYTGQQRIINPSIIREQYQVYANEQKNKIIDLFKKIGADILDLTTSEDFAVNLTKFLKSRVKKRKFRNN